MIPLEFNARTVPASEVARTFIPPDHHFTDLLARSHTLLFGPRGSGKTTLFKMLTVRALKNWHHPLAETYSKSIAFNGAFVPADVTWGTQIDALGQQDGNAARKEAAFVIHTLRALVHAMRESVELARASPPSHLAHLAVNLTIEQEERVAKLVSGSLNIQPAINSLLAVENALESLLDQVNTGSSGKQFSVNSLPSKISALVSSINLVSGDDERRWALLFDEMEIAPTRIKTFLLSSMRSFDERVIVKLALAPYMDDASIGRNPTSAQALHDYLPIQLTYPNKDDANQFTNELFCSTFLRLGVNVPSLPAIFSAPVFGSGMGRAAGRQNKGITLPKEFKSLAEKDTSFKRYLDDRGLLLPTYPRSESKVAQDIRKVLPIVIARDYYLRQFNSEYRVLNRSRKSYDLYTGYPSIVEITEGNPRAILTLVTPMVQHLTSGEPKKFPSKIASSVQSAAIRRVELLLTSLLQVVPLDLSGYDRDKGLLGFVDQIGRGFEEKLLSQPFRTDYVGTFVLDSNVDSSIISAVGKALNAGAFVHVPYEGGGPDSLLRGLVGQRFRLSYSLAARYRLLLILGDRVSLSKLLHHSTEVDAREEQPRLFDNENEQ